MDSYDARFSLPYVVGACLRRGRLTLAEFTEESLADPAIHSLADRVRIADDPESRFPEAYSAQLEITLRDGRVLGHREEVNRGHHESPLSRAEIEDKFLANMRQVADGPTVERLREAVADLGSDRSAREFAENCTRSGGAHPAVAPHHSAARLV